MPACAQGPGLTGNDAEGTVIPMAVLSVSADALRPLLRVCDGPGLRRLAVHLALIVAAGGLVWASRGSVWSLPAMFLLGVLEVALFTPLHETTHRTPFRSPALTWAVGLLAGFLLVLPPRWFHHFHMAHHRHAQDRARDPELLDVPPLTRSRYGYRLTGIPYWIGTARTLVRTAADRANEPWLPAHARASVVLEARLFLAAYALLAAAAVATRSTLPLWFWIGPVLLGQPVLRWVLMAEHAGCAEVVDPYSNTRTTLASWPLRYLFWNANFHAEHHLAPGVPFHALPRMHEMIRDRLKRLDHGYARAHRGIRSSLPR